MANSEKDTTQNDFSAALQRTNRPVLAAMAASVVLVGILIVLHMQSSGHVAQSDKIVRLAQDAGRQIFEMDRVQRNFYLTGDIGSRDNFDHAHTTLASDLDSIQGMEQSNPVQRVRAKEINSAALDWAGQASQVLATPSAAANRGVAADTTHVDDLTNQLTALADAETTARDANRAHFAVLLRFLSILAICLLVFGCLSISGARGGMSALFAQSVSSRQEQIDSLRKNQSLLSTTLHSMGEAVVAVDLRSRITFINPVAVQLTGWEEGDAIGKEISKVVSLVSERSGAAVTPPISSAMNDSVECRLEVNTAVLARDGTKRPVAGRCAPVWDDRQKVSGVILVFHDLSEGRGAKEALKSSEAHRETLFETALDAIVLMDHEGKVIEFNPAAEKIFGFRRVEALGRPVADLLVPQDLRERHRLGLQHYLTTGRGNILDKRMEMTALKKDKSEFPMEIAITQVPNSNPPVFAAYIRDITDRKQAEDALLRAKEMAEEESQAKSVFLNNMSDELRTPLNAVIGYSELLQEEAGERQSAEMVPDLQKIHEAGGLLLSLINDILDLSRIESGKMDLYLESFELVDVVRDAARSVQPLLAKNSNKLDVRVASDIGSMYADRLKVRQGLINLISNSSKLTRERALRLDVMQERARDGNRIVFRLSDTSPGMSEELMEKLLEALSSSDATSARQFGRDGLGLVVARHMCEQMGGELVGIREPGRPPTFSMRLPAKVGGETAK